MLNLKGKALRGNSKVYMREYLKKEEKRLDSE